MQQDLQQLIDWSTKWQMPFNTAKCKVMHLGRGNKEFQHFMNGHQIATVTDVQLAVTGVQLRPTSDMKPSRQCIAYSAASKVFAL